MFEEYLIMEAMFMMLLIEKCFTKYMYHMIPSVLNDNE